MTTRDRPRSLRTALVAAALTSLDRQGALPSWRALARECGVSQTAPYRHFDSFDALQAAVATECFRRFCVYVRGRLGRERQPFERLAVAIRAYVRFAAAHPHWYGLMFGRVVDLRRFPETHEAGMAAFGILAGIVADCGADDPAVEAYALWAAHHGLSDLTRLRIGAPTPSEREQALERIVRMSVDYLKSRVAAQRQ